MIKSTKVDKKEKMMMRINIVEPCQLNDRQLMAEYRELPRTLTIIKVLEAKGQSVKIPKNYVLGEGHIYFFYNKIKYLISRYVNIHRELSNCGFNLDHNAYQTAIKGVSKINNKDLFNDWQPAPEEIYLNMTQLPEAKRKLKMNKKKTLKDQKEIDEYRCCKIKQSARQISNTAIVAILIFAALIIWISTH